MAEALRACMLENRRGLGLTVTGMMSWTGTKLDLLVGYLGCWLATWVCSFVASLGLSVTIFSLTCCRVESRRYGESGEGWSATVERGLVMGSAVGGGFLIPFRRGSRE